jgi:hypothetical protein
MTWEHPWLVQRLLLPGRFLDQPQLMGRRRWSVEQEVVPAVDRHGGSFLIHITGSRALSLLLLCKICKKQKGCVRAVSRTKISLEHEMERGKRDDAAAAI